MIDTSLNKKYTAKKGPSMNFGAIPEGDYTLRVKEIPEWKETVKNVVAKVRNEDGSVLTDENGKDITETIPNCKYYNTFVKLEVVGGEYNGRLVFHNLSTHPNTPWQIPAFLYAIGMSDISAAEIQKATIGKECKAHLVIDTYEKTVQNKETGLDEKQEREINHISYFLDPEVPEINNSLSDDDLGL